MISCLYLGGSFFKSNIMSSSKISNFHLPVDKICYNEQGTVLMMAWMNRESLQKTLDTGETWYWSRSRQQLWHKGATSGHIQKVRSLRYDCDSDALLITVEQIGDIACHTGERSCFHQVDGTKVAPTADTLSEVYRVICDRLANPNEASYTCQLMAGGDNKILKKIGEESAEVVMACKDDQPDEINYQR